MPQQLRTVLTPLQALAAAAEGFDFDLPVNPLSVIVMTLRALNNTPVAANFAGTAPALMSKLSNVRVQYRGASVIDGDPLDVAMVHGRYSNWWPVQGHLSHTDNEVRSISWPILFGRHPFDPEECWPATRRGDLTMHLDTAADPTGLDGFSLQIETVELLDAAPARALKVTTTQRTLQAGDVNDIVLPIGTTLLGLLLRGVTFPTAALNNASYAENALEVDNVEVMYSRTRWRALHAEWARRTYTDWLHQGHHHLIRGSGAAAAAYAQATAIGIAADADGTSLTTGTAARSGITGVGPFPAIDAMRRYGFADFAPHPALGPGLDTRNAGDVTWHVNSDVTDGTASRALPIELLDLAGAGQAAAAA
jgi:hypothetical protein